MSDTDTGKPPSPSREAMYELERGLMRRIEVVERENRRLRRFGMTLVLGMGVLLGLAAALIAVTARRGFPGTVAEVVESRSFLLRDDRGHIRGAWGIADDGSLKLVLQDTAGQASLTLALLTGGAPGLTFADNEGRPRVVLGLLPDETTTLVFADGSGRTRTVLGLAPDGASTLAFADQGGTTRAGIALDSRGVGTFTLEERLGTRSVEPAADSAMPPATQ